MTGSPSLESEHALSAQCALRSSCTSHRAKAGDDDVKLHDACSSRCENGEALDGTPEQTETRQRSEIPTPHTKRKALQKSSLYSSSEHRQGPFHQAASMRSGMRQRMRDPTSP